MSDFPERRERPRRHAHALTSASRTVVARLLSALVVLWAAVTVAFLAIHLAPGDTATLLLGPDNKDDPVLLHEVIERWGLDRPVFVQYLSYLAGALHGDFGTSFILRKPVSEVIGSQLPSTLELTAVAAILAIIFAIVATLLTSGRGRVVRTTTTGVELVLVSLPSFWIGILLLALFSFRLGWFPVSGGKGWKSVILPALSLALPIGAYLAQVMREGVERALDQPFALTARSRGIGPLALRGRHALRHGALPMATLAGLIVGSLLGGAVVIEQVFGRPGLGQVAVAAVNSKDIPVILGVALISTAAFVICSTVVDLAVTLLDPRLRRAVPATALSTEPTPVAEPAPAAAYALEAEEH